jgi:hypothetical protein
MISTAQTRADLLVSLHTPHLAVSDRCKGKDIRVTGNMLWDQPARVLVSARSYTATTGLFNRLRGLHGLFLFR